MKLDEYKKLMNVSEEYKEYAELGEIQVLDLHTKNPLLTEAFEGMKIAIDVQNNLVLLLRSDNEITECFAGVFDVSPENEELLDFLKTLKSNESVLLELK